MKNYKSWLAFMVLLLAYPYALYDDKSAAIVDTTGYLLLAITLLMMVRSDVLNDIVKDLSTGWKERMKG